MKKDKRTGKAKSETRLKNVSKKRHIFREITDYFGILAGGIIAAFSFVWFIIPNSLAPGGVSGISTILHTVWGLPFGIMYFAINIPLFLVSWKELGWRFGIKSLLGALTLSLLTDALEAWGIKPLTVDPLLGAIFGGLMMGIGLGMVFACNGSTGGTDILCKMLAKHFPGQSLANYVLITDTVVIIFSGIASNSVLVALYSMICAFASSRAIDVFQHGLNAAKVYCVISDQHEEIARRVNHTLHRGATMLQGAGSFTGQDKQVLLCIVLRTEVAALKREIRQVDPNAFVFVWEASEVDGLGFYPEERPRIF